MRNEKEIKDKIESLKKMYSNTYADHSETGRYLRDSINAQIDALYWILRDERNGLPLIDEDDMYACYR